MSCARRWSSICNTRGFRCVSTHSSAEDAIHLLPKSTPIVILNDINLPKRNGIECVIQLKTLVPSRQIHHAHCFRG